LNQTHQAAAIGRCPACGAANPSAARFCNSCGAQIPVVPVREAPEAGSLVGALVGNRFIVEKKIGQGGMGVVYRGIQAGIQRPVALKVLHAHFARDATLLERFRNEAATASKLTHPNTVTIYDFGETADGAMYIAMEFVEGSDLASEVAAGPLEWRRACRIAEQVCGSLEEAHGHGIVHRDLKPDNIMLGRRGTEGDIVKVLDFGIAKMKAGQGQRQLTAAGEVFGTPEFMSPEQIRGDELGPGSDIYSLGVILFQMLAGELPFNAEQPMMTLVKHLTEPPPELAEIARDRSLPETLANVVMMCLAKRPESRPESMRELARILGAVAKPQRVIRSIPVEHPAPVKEVAPPPQKKEAAPQPPPAQKKEDAPRKEPPPDSSEKNPVRAETPAAPLPPGATQKERIVADLLARMKKKRDFPAVSQHISELNAKASGASTSARQLSNVILKDYSLTNKLLKLINSPYYGQVRGKITTVSHAVVLMGFESVRQAALGLLMFDHFAAQGGDDVVDLRNSVLGSLVSGLIAKGIAEKNPGLNKEEAFVCALFRQLGRNLVVFYFPELFTEIKKRMKARGEDEDTAAEHVLGVTFEELAKALGEKWSLPSEILESMGAVPPGDLEAPRSKGEKLRNLSSMSNELARLAVSGATETREADLAALFKRYGRTAKLGDAQLKELVTGAIQEIENYTQALDLGARHTMFVRRIQAWNGDPVSMIPPPIVSELPEPVARTSVPAEQAAKEERVAREKIMIAGVDEVAAAVSRHDDLNSIMMMVLETMYRGLALSRVLFCLNDVASGSMKARSGFGDGVEEMIRKFQFRIVKGRDVFSTTMTQGRDLVIDFERTPAYASQLPAWYDGAASSRPLAMLLYPILINSFPAGLFYGDLREAEKSVNRKLLVHMDSLRGHAAKAIKRTLPRGGR
jgi:eukaryotic-like serine/threonine-protein kinase